MTHRTTHRLFLDFSTKAHLPGAQMARSARSHGPMICARTLAAADGSLAVRCNVSLLPGEAVRLELRDRNGVTHVQGASVSWAACFEALPGEQVVGLHLCESNSLGDSSVADLLRELLSSTEVPFAKACYREPA